MTTPRTIPGPRGWDKWKLIGPLSRRPHELLLELATIHGDIVLLDFPLEPVVFLFEPSLIEHVLHHSYRNYVKRTGRWRSLRQIWGNGLITSDGDFWRRQRQRMQPAFHQDRINAYMDVFVEQAGHLVDTWGAAADRGTVRDVYVDQMDCALRVLTRAMFGADIEGQTDRIIRALADVHPYVNPASLISLIDPPAFVRRLVTPGYGKFERGLAEVHAVLEDVLRRRSASKAVSRDLLSLIMLGRDDEVSEAMSLAELHDEMMVILMAGHETTGIAAAWAWHWIARTPGVERALHDEVDAVLGDRMPTVADIPKLVYTGMVLDETLRMSPSIYAFDRQAVEEEVIGGYRIPKGATVGISPYAMHHHPKYWDQPSVFDPLRFSPERSAGRPDYAYFPFGGGPRRCVGLRFGQMQLIAVMAILARRFRVVPVPGQEPVPRPRLNLAPFPGVAATIHRRT